MNEIKKCMYQIIVLLNGQVLPSQVRLRSNRTEGLIGSDIVSLTNGVAYIIVLTKNLIVFKQLQ